MSLQRIVGTAACCCAVALTVDAHGRIISTHEPGGADAELRESAPVDNRGDNTELASRVAENRNSVMYVKLPVGDVTAAELNNDLTFRLTFRHENLAAGRITNESGENTGLDYYVLDPTHAGADWDENTIAPLDSPPDGVVGAPGYIFDGDLTTKSYDTSPGNLTFLGTQLFRSLNDENHMPVGEAHDFTLAPGSELHNAIVSAQATDHQSITIVAGVTHDWDNPHGEWINFNYIMNPKDQNPLREDAGYDMNVSADDGAEGSPWGGAANTIDSPFAPQLITVPEPSSILLLGLGAAALWRARRRHG